MLFKRCNVKNICIVLLALIFISCSDESEIASSKNMLLGTMKCNILDVEWNATQNAYAERYNDGNALEIFGSSETGSIYILIDTFFTTPKIYVRKFEDSSNYQYEFNGHFWRPNSRTTYSTVGREDTGKVIVESISDDSISGKFYYQASGITIRDGIFLLKFKN